MEPDRLDRPDPVDRLHPVLLHHIVNTLGWPDLRPLQKAAIDPLMDGEDAVLLAPTAGGKTEAASFPLLAAMENSDWQGISVLYLAPSKPSSTTLNHALRPTRDGWAVLRRCGTATPGNPRASECGSTALTSS